MNSELRTRFIATLQQHAQRDEIWQRISSHYSEPTRAYHNLDHIAACLTWFDKFKQHAVDALSLELAIWFHDVIYKTQPAASPGDNDAAKDNEQLSAEFAAECLGPQYHTQQITSLILATRHGEVELAEDAALICDIDLTILAASEEAYAAYQQQIRQEYSWVPADAYREGRGKVLQSFLQRERIFRTTHMSHLEEPARANLQREIAELQTG